MPKRGNGNVSNIPDTRQVDTTETSINDEKDPVYLPPSMSDDVLAEKPELPEMSSRQAEGHEVSETEVKDLVSEQPVTASQSDNSELSLYINLRGPISHRNNLTTLY